MFIDNKYKKWYYQIIDNARKRKTPDIKETHHIIPRCIGGSNEKENLVDLTPREHFICHWMLTKMTESTNKSKMTFSLHLFFHYNEHRRLNFNSRQYEYHKTLYIQACRERTPITKKDIYRFRHSVSGEDFIGTMYEFRQHSGLTGQDVNWLVRNCMKEDDPKKIIKKWGIWIDSLGIFSYDKYRPPYAIAQLPTICCEHCNKTVSFGNYKRWHGDRCKFVDPEGHNERTRQVAGINKN
jgi:hypothetical protein